MIKNPQHNELRYIKCYLKSEKENSLRKKEKKIKYSFKKKWLEKCILFKKLKRKCKNLKPKKKKKSEPFTGPSMSNC